MISYLAKTLRRPSRQRRHARKPGVIYLRQHLWWERRLFSPYVSRGPKEALKCQRLKRTLWKTEELLRVHRRLAKQEPFTPGAVTIALIPGHDATEK